MCEFIQHRSIDSLRSVISTAHKLVKNELVPELVP